MHAVTAVGILCLIMASSAENTKDRHMPTVDQLPELDDLPDPFRMNDGSRVASREDWTRRRREIAEMLAYYEYGHVPPPPGNLQAKPVSSQPLWDAKATLRRVVLEMGPDHRARMNVGLFVPSKPRGKMPVLMAVEPVWQEHLWPVARLALDRGYLFAGYDRHDLDKDDADRSDGVHPLYPECDWASLAVWAWGAMRLVDYLTTQDEVDPSKLALTGHSRAGKTALLAGALDERIALAAPHCSGAGGAGSYRVYGSGAETLAIITGKKAFHYWFQPRLRDFVGNVDRLPFDQHFLKALVAPRCIVSLEALADHWANPLGTQQMWRAVQPVFDFLGAADKNVIYFRPGGHDMTIEDWRVLLDYCDHFLLGKPLRVRQSPLPSPNAEEPFRWTPPTLR
ncbi:MAG: hypothetical protein JXQ73_06275 [Phycisphaerae bacterium]|nr:hypothetical protein [Phycisphaerae bacterium]